MLVYKVCSLLILTQRIMPQDEELLHRNSTVARRVTNVTSEHYGDP